MSNESSTGSFADFNDKVQKNFEEITKGGYAFVVEVDKALLWDTYLNSFRNGDNEVFRERREYDCNCCERFIRTAGAVVGIGPDLGMTSIWDMVLPESHKFKPVADALSELVHSKAIVSRFLHHESSIGVHHNFEDAGEDAPVLRWEHLYAPVLEKLVRKVDLPSVMGGMNTDYTVLKQSCEELTFTSGETVKELIKQDSLYRGQEFLPIVDSFLQVKADFNFLLGDSEESRFCWKVSAEIGKKGRFRSTVIGTLISDLSSGMELETAVERFEKKVAPENYKRTTAVITPQMIEKAEMHVERLGLTSALPRRYANVDDLTINNVIYADKGVVKQWGGVFADMARDAEKSIDVGKVEEIHITDFLQKVVPSADSIEVRLEPQHRSNLMSLIAPVDPDSGRLFNWGNNFSWSYIGGVTDAVKERARKAGGNVSGDLRFTLAWENIDDLDAHVIEPDGNRICFKDKLSANTGGCLDVDQNANSYEATSTPVENIVWKDETRLLEGEYKFIVHQYLNRARQDPGFTAEIEYGGFTHSFECAKPIPNRQKVIVATGTYTREDGFQLLDGEHLPLGNASETVWGIETNKFQKLSMILNSPNHWDGEQTGNKHLFFILDGCKNPEESRGIYSEYLRGELVPDRKVFEVLGAKLRVEKSDKQLSGIGFSSTVRNSVVVRVRGEANRVLKIIF